MNSLNDSAFPQHSLVKQRHKLVFHVPSESGDQLNFLSKEKLKQLLGDISLVAKELAKQALRHIRHRFSIVNVAWCEAEGKEFSLVIDNQMNLEAIEPTHCGLATFGCVSEDPMRMDTTVVTDSNGHGIHKGDTTALTFSGSQVEAQRKQCTWHEFHKAIVAHQMWESPSQMSAYFSGVVVLECSVA